MVGRNLNLPCLGVSSGFALKIKRYLPRDLLFRLRAQTQVMVTLSALKTSQNGIQKILRCKLEPYH